MERELLGRLLQHAAWANERVLQALLAVNPEPAPEVELYAHTLAAEEVWLARLEGRSPRCAVWPSFSLSECRVLAVSLQQAYATYLQHVEEAALQQPVAYQNSAGLKFQSTRRDILAHVALHGAYHRGQIALALRQHGAEPAESDYIAFVRGVAAAKRGDRPAP